MRRREAHTMTSWHFILLLALGVLKPRGDEIERIKEVSYNLLLRIVVFENILVVVLAMVV